MIMMCAAGMCVTQLVGVCWQTKVSPMLCKLDNSTIVTHHHHCRSDPELQTLRVILEEQLQEKPQQLCCLQLLLTEEVHFVLCQKC